MKKRILFLVGPEFEDIELYYPLYRLQEEGYETIVAGPSRDVIPGKKGYSVRPDLAFEEVDPSGYIGLVLPGGRGPERIRNNEHVKRIVRHFFDEEKPVAAICHGPQVLISAGVLRGRRATSYPGIKDDVVNAGAEWLDQPVVVDGNLVTARIPPDMPQWMREYIKLLRARG
ncbi:intracellular proteinase [Pyrodictium delaneyi]|uniref:Intracellular proteinase n=1 Tax=Pyrodictium delaneyi TaxID=1273541 RepID=A0A0N7JDC8_9CREN|nr:type 1 glutamine amidotransferase domain-containing protein [Pyrodictium delaneyi]ALL01833.1 intracellular proteinase [Pyrodictium delaneyi]